VFNRVPTSSPASAAVVGYSHVIYTLHLKRRYTFYMMNVILPCVMLSVLIIINFYLVPEAGEKVELGISVLLAFTVFLLMITESIPRTSLAVPLIGK
jgi:Neurotransmitter-gated ion-channel transmembrane region